MQIIGDYSCLFLTLIDNQYVDGSEQTHRGFETHDTKDVQAKTMYEFSVVSLFYEVCADDSILEGKERGGPRPRVPILCL